MKSYFFNHATFSQLKVQNHDHHGSILVCGPCGDYLIDLYGWFASFLNINFRIKPQSKEAWEVCFFNFHFFLLFSVRACVFN